MLGTQLVQHGTESRLRTHLDDLLGLPNVFFSSDAQNGESNEILVSDNKGKTHDFGLYQVNFIPINRCNTICLCCGYVVYRVSISTKCCDRCSIS